MKALIFDFDGTLCDSVELALEIYNGLADERGYGKITKSNLESIKSMTVLKIAKQLGVPAYKIPSILLEGRKRFSSRMSDLKWFKDIPETLKLLKLKGFRLFLVSSNSVPNILKFLGSEHATLFEAVLSSNRVLGKHQAIKKALSTYKLDPAESCYIGDEIRDIEAGKNAGIKTISVSWGYNSRESLLKHNPDHLVSSPEELLSVLASI